MVNSLHLKNFNILPLCLKFIINLGSVYKLDKTDYDLVNGLTASLIVDGGIAPSTWTEEAFRHDAINLKDLYSVPE